MTARQGRMIPGGRGASDMSVVVVVAAFPVPEHRAEVVAAFEAAIARVHDEPGVELYALHEGRHRLVTIEKYESERARSEHARGAPLADLRAGMSSADAPRDARSGTVPRVKGDSHDLTVRARRPRLS